MSSVQQVIVPPFSPARLQSLLTKQDWAEFAAATAEAQEMLRGRVTWHVNSTAVGGGVAEMLRSFIAYSHSMDLDTRWMVISGNEDFFAITKRIHNFLHGVSGDGGQLGPKEHEIYQAVMKQNIEELVSQVKPGDIVVLHDPQTAGLCARLKETGAAVVWRSHVGTEQPNEHVDAAWNFINPYIEKADVCVFTRPTYVHSTNKHRIEIIPPSIDAFSPKNQDMSPETARSILSHVGLPVGDNGHNGRAFVRQDGSPGWVESVCEIIGEPLPQDTDVPLVTQISRWDLLKDHLGVMLGFVEHTLAATDAHLILAGPGSAAVADDPEGIQVQERVREAWADLPDEQRCRVHLVCLPMNDIDENAAIVNALQRHSTIIVQKSLQEGFGLTVAEAMWKGRPVVASAVGGIQDQIVNGVDGVLLPYPYDLESFGVATRELLESPETIEAMGLKAREHVRREFLDNKQWLRYISLFKSLI